MSEPIIGTKYDFNKETQDYFVEVKIMGISTEQEAVAALDFVEKALCGEPIKFS